VEKRTATAPALLHPQVKLLGLTVLFVRGSFLPALGAGGAVSPELELQLAAATPPVSGAAAGDLISALETDPSSAEPTGDSAAGPIAVVDAVSAPSDDSSPPPAAPEHTTA
jgi:hypothetical protein